MPIWPSLPRALRGLGVDPNSPLGRFNRRVKRTGRAIEELPELPEEVLDWAIRAPDEELEVGPPGSLATPPVIPTTGTAATPYGTDIGVPSRPPRRNRITGEMDIPESGMWWEWSDTGTNEPRPEEGQQWLQRAGAGTSLPQPLSNAELSEASYQFPNAPHIQEAWGRRRAEDLATATRTQQALDTLREAETETSPLVSGWREKQALQEAYPSREQALGMTRSSAISAQAGITRANVAAQAVLQRAALDAAARGNLAESNRYRAKLDAFSRVAGLPQDEAAKKAMAFLLAELERDMPEIAAQISDFMAEESEDEYGDAIEGLRGAY